MSGWTTAGAFALGCTLILYIGRQAFDIRGSTHPLPPSPPGLPWIGNVIGIDTSAPWITYAEWAKTYGDLVYSRLLGKDLIIINSEKTAKDLLEKRSRNYSDRPYLITNKLCGLDMFTAMLPYGEKWRLQRRFFHQTFRLDAVPRFLLSQHRKSCNLLRRLFDAPERLDEHLFEYVCANDFRDKYTASIILNSVYDYDPASRKDELVDTVANVLDITVPAGRPDVSIIVGAFPLLLHLPSWFPGMSFKRKMEKARAYAKHYLDRPFEYSLRKVLSSSVAPSMIHDALQHVQNGVSPDESWMETLKEASGTAFLGASETSNSVLRTFFLMMMLNPPAQEKAQAQIDTIVGKTRLPAMEDRPLLPYIDAILWEIFRYNPVAPLSIPHAVVDDDVYDGFRIPKGAIVLSNLWSMARDETKYPNSHVFLPERFLNDDGSLKPCDIEHIAYGFGRRICPGRHFADTSVWMVIAKVLAVFKILKPLDESGAEIVVEPKFSTGVTIQPLPFKCRIIPRFPGMDAEKLEGLIVASTS